MMERMREEVVQRFDADDDWRQGGGNLRVAHVADVRGAVDKQVVDLGVEGTLDLRPQCR